jgi:hypothetical protein
MPVIYEVVAHGEKYTTQTGEEKSRLIQIGKVIEKQNGKMSLKLDTVPLNWDGWAMLLEPRPRDETTPAKAAPKKPARDDSDEIPF